MNESQPLISCEECGLVVAIPDVVGGQKACCPRCGHQLTSVVNQPYQRPVAYAIACLLALMLSVSFPFMSFSIGELSQEITLLQVAGMLKYFENASLALLLLGTVIVLPTIYVSAILYLHIKAGKYQNHVLTSQQNTRVKLLCRIIFAVEPWLMVDVFLIGVLVSLIKIASLADINMGSSFWAFCVYTVLVVKCISMVDKRWLWDQFIPIRQIEGVKAGDTHHSRNHLSCHVCHQINPMSARNHSYCIRCNSQLNNYVPHKNIQHSWALLIASATFYIPANLCPIMYTVSLGESEGSTIIEGVLLLWSMGSYPIAAIIFFASVFIPIAKMFTLGWLYYNVRKMPELPLEESMLRLKVYRVAEFIGRWSMIDIFVIAILVALVQLNNLMEIYPGPAALYFAAVVILTMFSAVSFDPRLLWNSRENK
ncbi:paraquat-inducible protein A [Shewanella sp. VB17]|nr:paraquat-inducible protein A [Shewanella sp. VB17]